MKTFLHGGGDRNAVPTYALPNTHIDNVEVHVINRPGAPFLGTGEAAMGPIAAAIANALTDATGPRLRDLPLSADKVKTAMLR